MNDELYTKVQKLKMKDKNNKNKKDKIVKKSKYLKSILYKSLITTVLVLSVLIIAKASDKYKAIIKQNVFDKNFSFASVNEVYTKYLGSALPFKDIKIFKEETKTTFEEKLKYTEANKYLDGVKLTVEQNYLVPIQESGLVVFTGEKEGYGNIVIIQQVNGIDMWYGNLNNNNVNLYDYVEKGSLLGEVKDTNLYLVYQKDGKYVDYKEYIEED